MFKKKPFGGPGRSLAEEKPKDEKAPPKPKADPNIVSVRFEFQLNGKMYRTETKFAISQQAAVLYTYLEEDVFLNPEGLEVVQAFPRLVIPRSEEKTLGQLKLRGQVMLQALFKGTPALRNPLD